MNPTPTDAAGAPRRIAIAIDGPASSGKGTVARLVARKLGYAWIDTGAMYRAVALLARERGVAWSDAEALARIAREADFAFSWDGATLRLRVDGRDVSEAIRTDEIGRGASDVSVHPAVRAALLDRQRALGRAGGVVMDGRDIGTVVLPDAEVKIYLDATPEERARRRHREFLARGIDKDFAEVLAEIRERDHQDSTRAAAPLRAAEDARVIDSTGLTPEEVADRVLAAVRERLESGAAGAGLDAEDRPR